MKPAKYKVGPVEVEVRPRTALRGEGPRIGWEIFVQINHPKPVGPGHPTAQGVIFPEGNRTLDSVNVRAACLARIFEELKDYEQDNTRLEESET